MLAATMRQNFIFFNEHFQAFSSLLVFMNVRISASDASFSFPLIPPNIYSLIPAKDGK